MLVLCIWIIVRAGGKDSCTHTHSFAHFHAVPQRTCCTLSVFQPPGSPSQVLEQGGMNGHSNSEEPPTKRQMVVNGDNGPAQFVVVEDIMEEAGRFAQVLACTVEPEST